MKNLPKQIYLQLDPENEKPEDFNDLCEVTWSKDKVFETDQPYVLKGFNEFEEGVYIGLIHSMYEMLPPGKKLQIRDRIAEFHGDGILKEMILRA